MFSCIHNYMVTIFPVSIALLHPSPHFTAKCDRNPCHNLTVTYPRVLVRSNPFLCAEKLTTGAPAAFFIV